MNLFSLYEFLVDYQRDALVKLKLNDKKIKYENKELKVAITHS